MRAEYDSVKQTHLAPYYYSPLSINIKVFISKYIRATEVVEAAPKKAQGVEA